MFINNFENSNFIISNDVSFKEAMSVITSNHRGCVIVVDENNHLVGALSDGDIRRALVKGTTMLASIINAVNSNPVFLKKEERNLEEQANKIFTERIAINLDDGVLVNYNKFGKSLKEVGGLNDKKTKDKVSKFNWNDITNIP